MRQRLFEKSGKKSFRLLPAVNKGQALYAGNTVDLQNYLPILLFIAVGIGVGVAPQVLGRLLAPHRPDTEKNSAYECGFEAFEDAQIGGAHV